MKTLKRLLTLCVIFVFSTISLTACKSTNNNTSERSDTNQSAESFCVEFSSSIEIECANENIVSESDGKLYVVADSKITPVLKDLKNKNFLEIGFIPNFVVNGKTISYGSTVKITKDTTITLSKNYVKIVGVAVYQNHPTNPNFNNISDPADFISKNITINKLNISTNNEFIFTAKFDEDTMHSTSNTTCYLANSSNHFTVGIEVMFETTETYAVLILEDTEHKNHFVSLGKCKLTSNGTNNVFEYTRNITPNILSPINKFTLKLSNNFSTKK